MLRSRSLVLLVVVFMLLMVCGGVMAQDTASVPVADNSILIPQEVFAGFLVILALLLMVQGGSVFALYRSAPPSIQFLVRSFIEPVITLLEDRAEASKDKIDDAAIESIKARLREEGLLLEPYPAQPPRPPQPSESSPFEGRIGSRPNPVESPPK